MLSFISKISTNKKIIFFVFIGAVLTIFLVAPIIGNILHVGNSLALAQFDPGTAQAIADQSKASVASSTPTSGTVSIWDSLNPITVFKKAASATASSVANALIFAFAVFPLVLSAVLADICTVLFKFFLLMVTGGNLSYTGNSAVKIGWPLVRDLANMVIVLGFVIIGVATALRVKEYEAKQLLSKLIVVALFVNFSLLICGVVIDISNILVNFFAKVGDLSDFGNLFNSSGLNVVFSLIKNVTEDNPIAFLIKALSIVVFNLVLVAVLSLYTLLFAFRVAAIWLLVILSPLAFVFSVFPATRKFYETWMNNFIQWCFIGVPATFFLYLAHQSMAELTKTKVTFESLGTFSQSLTNFASLIVPAIFLIMGFLMTVQASSALAGGGLVRWAGGKAKMGGMAMGRAVGVNSEKLWKATGGKWAGSLGNNLKGLSDRSSGKIGKGAGWAIDKVIGGGLRAAADPRATVDKRRSAFGRGLEAIGAISGGAAGVADIKKVEEESKKVKFRYDRAKLSNDRKTIDGIQNDARTAQGITGAASYKVISDAKDLTDTFKDSAGNVDFKSMYSRGKFAENNGAQGVISANEKLNPVFRADNDFEVEEILKKTNPSLTIKTATTVQLAAARKQAIREGTAKQNQREATEISHKALENVDVQLGLNAAKVKAIGRSGKQSAINSLRTLKKGTPEYAAILNDLKARGVAKGSTEYNQIKQMLKQIATDPNFA